jgi:type VI secretion system FHA domain protein
MVTMLDARARARAEIGATATVIELNGNNPLKFLRHPDAALSRLINPAERGFMEGDAAVEASFRDVQAHQLATVAAMQNALRATLARFSPDAIRQRAESRGLLAKILPAARDAALWQAYQREFEGVVQGSDEAFMDVFAKAFRDAYSRVLNKQ